jgi:hypothetical protein
MSNNNLFRIAGWCAILSVLLMGSFFVASSIAPTSPVAVILAFLGVAAITLVFYALYVVHRSESAGLSLAGLVLWVLAGVLDITSLLNPTNTILYAADSLLFSLPFLIFGFLAYRSAKMPRGLAWMALLSGVFWLIAGAASFIGSPSIGMVASLGGFAFLLAWLIWLWRVFWSGKLATAAA